LNDQISVESNGLEHAEIQEVLGIAKELARQNKIIQPALLYKIAKRRLKLESETLLSIINLLLKNKILIEGSKLLKQEVLLNPYRVDIFRFIKTYPGVHFSVIRKKVFSEGGKTGSTGQFIWHIEVLMKFNFIKRIQVKNYSLFLSSDMDEELGIYYFLLRDRINRKIVIYLNNNEPIEQAQIPNKILESKGSVYYHIKTLEEYKVLLLEKNNDTGNKEVRLDQEKKELFIKISNDIENIKF